MVRQSMIESFGQKLVCRVPILLVSVQPVYLEGNHRLLFRIIMVTVYVGPLTRYLWRKLAASKFSPSFGPFYNAANLWEHPKRFLEDTPIGCIRITL